MTHTLSGAVRTIRLTLCGATLAVALIGAATAATAAAATTAGAATAAAHAPRFFGGLIRDVPTGTTVQAPSRAHTASLPYAGGPVLHWNRAHLIFWEPSGSGLQFEAGYESLVEQFLSDVAAGSHSPGNVYGLSGQYRDAGGPAAYNVTYGGATVATDALPPSGCVEPLGPPLGDGPGWSPCMSDFQLSSEIDHVVSAHHLRRAATDVYFLLTPNGLGSCEYTGPEDCALGGSSSGSYCGYHSVTSGGLLYAVIPYNAVSGHCQSDNPRPNSSAADPAVSTISHEHNEAVTDPHGDAWIDTSGDENGDLCITDFGPPPDPSDQSAFNETINAHHYFLQTEWSNEDGSCQLRDEPDRISFSPPRRLTAHVAAGFTPRASDPDGAIVAYNWFFGDRRTGHGRRVSHTFRRTGRYRVVLRTTDRAGNWAFFAARVSVARGTTTPRSRSRRS